MMLASSWYFFVLLNAFYGGALTMFFTSETTLPFETERDVIRAYPDWNLMLQEGNEFLFLSKAMAGDQDYQDFVDRMEDIENDDDEEEVDVKFSSIKEGLDKLLEGQNVIQVTDSMLNGFFHSNPFHQQNLKTFASARRSRIDGLIYPLNSPVREVMRLASSRLFESGAVEYLVKKWEGNGVPETSGG